MDRMLIDRRIDQMEREGVIFRPNMEIGVNVPVERLMDDYCVLVLAAGAEQPRDLSVPGRDLGGIHFAMDYLTQSNKRNSGYPEPDHPIVAAGKHVVVIGGGDTGSDCIGTAHRQGAASVAQLEIMPEPPLRENKGLSWPLWPMKLRTSSSQEEGAERAFSIVTTHFEGEDGRVTRLVGQQDGQPFALKADLVLLAMGFLGSPPEGILGKAGVEMPEKGYATARDGVFACGDMRRGQSLVVWAIREGRECAAAVDEYLKVNAAR
jgi:glutamate synthase (NADPH/NADH) small chain